jgi:hypothetical protein
MSSMRKSRPLSYKKLRRITGDIEEWTIVESNHAKEKHPRFTLADIVLGFKEPWKSTTHRFDKKYNCWVYEIMTTGFNGEWFKICFAVNEHRKQIRILTRFQDEYKA